MDILKVLNSCPIVDLNPCSDAEREEGNTRKIYQNIEVKSDPAFGEKKKRSKKVKTVMLKTEGDMPSLADIIAERPSKKEVMEFIRMRIAQLVAEDSD
jgi:hypothetical protein